VTRLPVIIVLLVAACGGRRDEAEPGPRAPQPPPATTTPPAPAAPDPWAGTGAGSGDATVSDIPIPDAAEALAIADAACPAVTAPYFYRVEKKGKTSHLLGTRHLGVDYHKMPPEVIGALGSASLAVFETSPDDRSDEKLPPVDHGPMSEELGAQAWARYQELVGPELALAVIDAEPATALLVLLALYEDKSVGLDDDLQKIAALRSIPIQGLETNAFQEQVIRKWLDVRALAAAIAVTDDRAEVKQTTVDDLVEYCGGTDEEPGLDPKERKDMLDAGYTDAELTQYTEELVFARNRDWIPKLDKLFAKGDVFVAVGADHLTGDRGVVALLRAKGYQVTRVFSPK
jgi:uncharacterized protein